MSFRRVTATLLTAGAVVLGSAASAQAAPRAEVSLSGGAVLVATYPYAWLCDTVVAAYQATNNYSYFCVGAGLYTYRG